MSTHPFGCPNADEPAPGLSPEVTLPWGDPVARDALEVIAEGLTQLAGFDVAAISVMRDAQHLQVMAVAGSDAARAELQGMYMPVDRLLAELEEGEDWGRFRFVAHDRRTPGSDDWGWVPDLAPSADPAAWHPLDLLVAPLRGSDGVLRGALSIDCPTDGRRPDLPRRRVLERYAAQAARAVALAVEREQLAEQVRMLSAARRLVREVSGEQTISGLMGQIRQGLIDCFRARGLWVQTFADDGHRQSTVRTASGGVVPMPRDLVRTSESVARQAWATHAVATVSRGSTLHSRPTFMTPVELRATLGFLERVGLGSVLLVPLGAGTECLGTLVLTRRLHDPEWSDTDAEAALEVGRDLGRLLVNTRAFERERAAVCELQALDEYKTTLIATLSHELKSPLTAMLANLELLGQIAELDDPASAVLGAVERGAGRLVRVVEDLLLLARVGDPHSPPVPVPVDLCAVVDEVRAQTAIASQDRLQVDFEGCDAPGLVALGEPAELEILVGNLVSNALKYSYEDTPVALAVGRVGDEVLISCSDRGIGIGEADLDRLFEEFFRSDSLEARRRGGTGLGLAIVDRIVTRHAGRVEVESELGAGTVFRVYLPAAG